MIDTDVHACVYYMCLQMHLNMRVRVMLILHLHSAVIPAVLAKNHTILKCAVSVEEIDLHKIYLIVKGFPPFVNNQFMRHHFQIAANDAEIQSIEMRGREASITYVNPQGKGTYSDLDLSQCLECQHMSSGVEFCYS